MADVERYNYDSERACLVSRRPTVLHSCFMSLVAREIITRIHEIAESDDLASSSFAKNIHGMGSARLDLLGTEQQEGKPKMRRDPDYSFKHYEARWPGVVLELSYPAKRRALPHLADDYLLETNGDIRILVGLDLDTVTKRATISTWQPQFKRNEQGVITEMEAALVRDEEVFRDKYGNANADPEAGLHLDLEDFGPTDLTVDLIAEVPIFVDSARLCLLLAQAEAQQFNMDMRQGGVPYKPKGLRIRKRRREEMESDAEVSGQGVIECDNVAAGHKSAEEKLVERDEKMEDANIASGENLIEKGKAVSVAGAALSTPALQEEGSEEMS